MYEVVGAIPPIPADWSKPLPLDCQSQVPNQIDDPPPIGRSHMRETLSKKGVGAESEALEK